MIGFAVLGNLFDLYYVTGFTKTDIIAYFIFQEICTNFKYLYCTFLMPQCMDASFTAYISFKPFLRFPPEMQNKWRV